MGQLTVLSAVGDINLGDRAVMVGLGTNSLFGRDPGYDPFGAVRSMLFESDLTFGNLECVLSDHGLDRTKVESRMMRAAPRCVRLLKNAGFDLLSIANNHIMQHGARCFSDTVQTISAENILPIGLADEQGKNIPRFVTRGVLKFGILGYCLRPEKYTTPALYASGQVSNILKDIEHLQPHCDYLIVSLHWGDEYMDYPSSWQIEAAHSMIDHGAAVILGHHPHVLQGVEKYNGGVIAYSLGNFVFDVWQKRLRESMVLQIAFSRDGIEEINRVPVYIASDFSPRPLPQGRHRLRLINRFESLDALLRRYPQSTTYLESVYAKKARMAERINQIQNRMLFLWQLPRYERSVSLQCLSGFIRSRIAKE